MESRTARRLRVLHDTGLLDTAPEAAFDRVTRLAARLLGAPVSLVSLVDRDRQFFKSEHGLSEPYASTRETPLRYSFCRYVVSTRAAMAVADARLDSRLHENPAIAELGMLAYAGTPLMVEGEAIGALCVVDTRARAWTEEDLAVLGELAETVVTEIALRRALADARRQQATTEALIESFGDVVMAIDTHERFTVVNPAARRVFPEAEPGQPHDEAWLRGPRLRRADGRIIERADAPLLRALAGEATDGLTVTFDAEGSSEPRWLDASGRPIRDVQGKIVGAIVVYRDVTESKRRADTYHALARSIPGGAVALFDHELRFLAADGEMMRRIGVDPANLVGMLMEDAVSPENRDRMLDLYRRTLAGESVEAELVRGRTVLSIRCAPVLDESGRVTAGISLTQDVTRQRREANLLSAIARNVPNGAVVVVDHDLRYVFADGPRLFALLGREKHELEGAHLADSVLPVPGDQPMVFFRRVLAGAKLSVDVAVAGRSFSIEAVPLVDDSGHVLAALASAYDVTDRALEVKELERARALLEQQAAKLREVSVKDELTGLHNRRGFMMLAEQALRVAARSGKSVVLVFLDLDGMKEINDRMGHEAGDRALVDTAAILRRTFRDCDVVARLGGDEFVVLATDAAVESGALFPARLADAVRAYNDQNGGFRLSLSVGTALFDPRSPRSLEALLSEADARMYEAKRGQGRARSGGIQVS